MKHVTVFALTAFTLLGCAHGTMRGTVAMKVSDQEAHVCLGDNAVKAGDKVALFRNDCVGRGQREGSAGSCRLVKIGEGQVERTLNEHYSVVRVGPGVTFGEGTLVEKL